MNTEADQIGRLRARYLEQIQANESAIATIRIKLKVLNEVVSDARELAGLPVSVGRYSKMKLTPAVLDGIRSIGANDGVTASQVREYIFANGYRHASKHFAVATVLCLNRLVKQEKILSEKKHGKRLYTAKTQ